MGLKKLMTITLAKTTVNNKQFILQHEQYTDCYTIFIGEDHDATYSSTELNVALEDYKYKIEVELEEFTRMLLQEERDAALMDLEPDNGRDIA